MTRDFDYWKRRGITYVKPTPFVGSLGPILTMKYSIGEYVQKIYKYVYMYSESVSFSENIFSSTII